MKLGPHQELTVLSHDPDALVMEAAWSGSDVRPPMHLHPEQTENFEVLDGELQAIVGGEERTLRAGDTLEVPPGTPHSMWSPAGGRARWETRPAYDTLLFFQTLAGEAEPHDKTFAREFRLA